MREKGEKRENWNPNFIYSKKIRLPRQCIKMAYVAFVDRPKRIYKFIAQLPKDYCLIPGNCTIKIVETKNLLELIIFNFGFGLIYCKGTGRQVIKWI